MPSPGLGGLFGFTSWKRAELKAENHKHTDLKSERIERAIADDVEFLKTHPTRRSLGSNSNAPHRPPARRPGDVGIAGADRDRASVDIAVVDVPAFLGGISRSAAGELGHTPMIPGFYPGSEPGEQQNGTAATFDEARADFECAWQTFLSKRTEADFQACNRSAESP